MLSEITTAGRTAAVLRIDYRVIPEGGIWKMKKKYFLSMAVSLLSVSLLTACNTDESSVGESEPTEISQGDNVGEEAEENENTDGAEAAEKGDEVLELEDGYYEYTIYGKGDTEINFNLPLAFNSESRSPELSYIEFEYESAGERHVVGDDWIPDYPGGDLTISVMGGTVTYSGIYGSVRYSEAAYAGTAEKVATVNTPYGKAAIFLLGKGSYGNEGNKHYDFEKNFIYQEVAVIEESSLVISFYTFCSDFDQGVSYWPEEYKGILENLIPYMFVPKEEPKTDFQGYEFVLNQGLAGEQDEELFGFNKPDGYTRIMGINDSGDENEIWDWSDRYSFAITDKEIMDRFPNDYITVECCKIINPLSLVENGIGFDEKDIAQCVGKYYNSHKMKELSTQYGEVVIYYQEENSTEYAVLEYNGHFIEITYDQLGSGADYSGVLEEIVPQMLNASN